MSGVGPTQVEYGTLARIRRRVDRDSPRALHPGVPRRRSGRLLRNLRRCQRVVGPTPCTDRGPHRWDPTNNRRENLRLMCPNCDSQLPTYKSRTVARGGTCGDSGTPTVSRTDKDRTFQRPRPNRALRPTSRLDTDPPPSDLVSNTLMTCGRAPAWSPLPFIDVAAESPTQSTRGIGGLVLLGPMQNGTRTRDRLLPWSR